MNVLVKVNDAERIAIEKEITEIYQKVTETTENVDTSSWSSISSDVYNLGVINSGEFTKTIEEFTEAYRALYSQLERQEILERPEFHLAVLAPDVVVGTELNKTVVYYKDGNVFTGIFAHTFVYTKIDGEWKLIHIHQSMQPVE